MACDSQDYVECDSSNSDRRCPYCSVFSPNSCSHLLCNEFKVWDSTEFCKEFILSNLLNNMQSDPYAPQRHQMRYVEKRAQILHASSSMLPFSETYRPSKNCITVSIPQHLINHRIEGEENTFRISLFRTLQIC